MPGMCMAPLSEVESTNISSLVPSFPLPSQSRSMAFIHSQANPVLSGLWSQLSRSACDWSTRQPRIPQEELSRGNS